MKPLMLIITDTHLKEQNTDVVVQIFYQAMSEALKHDLTTVYCLGDIFESRKGQLATLLSTFEEILDMYQDNGILLVTCVGNHDKTDYISSYSFLSPFKHHPALHLVPGYETFDIDENTTFSLLSFFDDVVYLQYITKLIDELARDSPGKRHLLGTHIGISGVKIGLEQEFKSEKIREETFKFFHKVYVGHFHDRADYFGNVHYIGAACQHSFGENEDKGAVLLTYRNNEIVIKIVPLDTPIFRTITLEVKDIGSDNLSNLEKMRGLMPNDYLRVILEGTEAEVRAFDKKQILNLGYSVVARTTSILRTDIEGRVQVFDNKAIKDQFEDFCEKQNIDLVKGQSYLHTIIQ